MLLSVAYEAVLKRDVDSSNNSRFEKMQERVVAVAGHCLFRALQPFQTISILFLTSALTSAYQ